VIHSLEAALWAFHRSDSFREGALRAVNLGNDADTTGAIYGQLAGAFYSLNGIPQDWLERLAMGELIGDMADALFDFSITR
jgi:ADP-ribosyl-[dinitrogen reductase] hydrolase